MTPEPVRILWNGWRLALVERGRLWSYVRFQGRERRVRIRTADLVTAELEPETAARLLAAFGPEPPSEAGSA